MGLPEISLALNYGMCEHIFLEAPSFQKDWANFTLSVDEPSLGDLA